MRARVFSPKIGAPVFALVGAAIFVAFALSIWGSGSVSGLNDGGSIKGVIEWTHQDANGTVLARSLKDNTTLDLIKNDARGRIGVSSTLADADLYDEIALCSNDASGAACTLSTVGNITEANPQEGSGSAGGTGVYSVALTFTATGAVTIEELQLVKGNNADAAVPTTSEIGAWQNVSVTLANGDTLTITWTVTIS